jgi:predicted MFS family arabinose efflux permease
LFDVSYQAYVPSLVERENIVEANAKLTLTESIAEVTGPGLTGVLVQLITAPLAILLDALSFVCSAVSLAVIIKPEPRPARGLEPHMVREIREGLRFSWRDPALRALILFTATSAFFLGFYASLYELFANRELGVGPALLGAVISVGGIGSLFGSIISEQLVRRCGAGPVLIGSAGVLGIAALLPPLARGPVWAAAGVLILAQVFDAAWPVYTVCARSLRQAIAPERLLGRVNAAIHLTFGGVLPVGALAGGMLADVIGARFTLLAGGLGFLLASLWLVFSPIRQMRDLWVRDAGVEETQP